MSYSPVLHACLKEIKYQADLPFEQMRYVRRPTPAVCVFVGPFPEPELGLLRNSDLVEAARNIDYCIYRQGPQAPGSCNQFFGLSALGIEIMELSEEQYIRYATASADTLKSLCNYAAGTLVEVQRLSSLLARFWVRPTGKGSQIEVTPAGQEILSIIRQEFENERAISQLLTSPPRPAGSEKQVLTAYVEMLSSQSLEPAVLAGLGREIVAQLEEAGFHNDLGGGR